MNNYKYQIKNSNGFTLIEMLIVIAIIAVLSGVSLFAMEGSRQSARDAKRKADIEALRSALELYHSDCNAYPASVTFGGSELKGDGSSVGCATTNIYMQKTPDEQLDDRSFYYSQVSAHEYVLCAALETDTTIDTQCGAASSYNCTLDCTYGTTQP